MQFPCALPCFNRVQHPEKTNRSINAELDAPRRDAEVKVSTSPGFWLRPAAGAGARGSPTHGDGARDGDGAARGSRSLPLGRDRRFHNALVLPVTEARSAISTLVTSKCCFHIKFNKAGVTSGLLEGVGAKTKRAKQDRTRLLFLEASTLRAGGCASVSDEGGCGEGAKASGKGSPGACLYRGSATSSLHNHTHKGAPLQAAPPRRRVGNCLRQLQMSSRITKTYTVMI